MHKISTRQIVADIQSGLDDDQLMAKYRLPPKLFQRLLQKLVAEKVVRHEDLYEISAWYRYICDVLLSRRYPRVYIPVALRVYQDGSLERGFVRDISEEGLRVAGIEATPGQVVSLSMPLTEIPLIGPVRLEAVCRWSERKGENSRFAVSGFEITTMSEGARGRFAQLIEWFRIQPDDEEQEITNNLKTMRWPNAAVEQEPSTQAREFSGTMNGVDILDLLHCLLLSGLQEILHVHSSKGRDCRLYVSNGKIVHAVGSGLEGREALFLCATFPGGTFSTQPWEEPGCHTISEPSDFLLFEAARRGDELHQSQGSSEQREHGCGGQKCQQPESCCGNR